MMTQVLCRMAVRKDRRTNQNLLHHWYTWLVEMATWKYSDFLYRRVYLKESFITEWANKIVNVQTGAQVNCFATAYLTPLHVAVERGHLQVNDLCHVILTKLEVIQVLNDYYLSYQPNV